MNTQSSNDYFNNSAVSEQNRQVLVWMLLSKFALVLVIGLIYGAMRFLG